VGDYVRLRKDLDNIAIIEALLQRMNLFARREVYGSHLLQPIAANLSTLFITIAVNSDFSCTRHRLILLSTGAIADVLCNNCALRQRHFLPRFDRCHSKSLDRIALAQAEDKRSNKLWWHIE
jgi:putative ribosome biogenesis GTPase RsgA